MQGIPRSPKEIQRSLALLGTFRRRGWQRSARLGRPVSFSGRPLPWWSYSAIRFIEPRLRQSDSVFEFGAGASTLWFQDRIGRITSVEHDPEWAKTVEMQLDPDSNLVLVENGETDPVEYVQPFRSLSDSHEYPSIVVVDGIHRNHCVDELLESGLRNAVVVFDDADRPEYSTSLAKLDSSGFRRLDFWGISPGYAEECCTSVLTTDLDALVSKPIWTERENR